MALNVLWMIFKKHIVATLIAVAILLGVAGSIYVGYFWGTVEGKAERTALATTLAQYKESLESARHSVSAGNAVQVALEMELSELQIKRSADEKLYKDSLAVVRTYLPDRAEREIATYYARYRGRRRDEDDTDPDDAGH